MVTESSQTNPPAAAKAKAQGKITVTVSDRLVKGMSGSVKHKDRYSGGIAGNIQILFQGRADLDDRESIYRLTEEGIPVNDVLRFVHSLPMFKEDHLMVKILGVSERTMHRRLKNPEEPLNPDQSARAVRFAQVLNKAIRVFGTPESAEHWMSNPAMGLDGHKPIDLLSNPLGFELVDEFLIRLEYGVYQ